MKPIYVLMDADDDNFILPRLLDKVLKKNTWTDNEISDMHLDVGREFTQIRYRYETEKEATTFMRKLERIRKAIIKNYKKTIKRYPHMEDIYYKYLEHHQLLKLKVVKVTITDC